MISEQLLPLYSHITQISLLVIAAGAEDSAMEDGIIEITKVVGKPVKSVIGYSPIHAWGNALAALGLIDEITLSSALEALDNHREQGMDNAKDNFEAKKKARAEWRARQKEKGGMGSPAPSVAEYPGGEYREPEEKDDETNSEEKKNEQDIEDAESESEQEKELRGKVEALKSELERARQDDREAAIALSDARIRLLGPFMCNPFQKHDTNYAQETAWLTTAVRKEKHKMGSTGSKKKIITATDLLERNNTFFNPDIETLVEGLPGSEYCSAYVFQASRTGGASTVSSAWIHEAKLRQQREREKLKEKSVPKEASSSSVIIQHERDAKRKYREEINNARKKQRQDEMDQKKAARAQERLTRLSLQVDERLFKEACVQRERVVLGMQKFLIKEFGKRRKAAELIAGQSVLDGIGNEGDSHASRDLHNLSPLCKVYDEEVLRLWDFFCSYGDTFLKWGYVDKLPTLDVLQSAIDALRDPEAEKRLSIPTMSRDQALAWLINLAVAICKPISVSLTRFLFASLIALNPALQKDFGAAFFADIRTNADATTAPNVEGLAEGKSVSDLLPVTQWTWQEIARLSFLSDATVALGYQKHESAHLLRGYRSSGHPNSKEAKRLRKTEEYHVSVLRQKIVLGEDEQICADKDRIRISAPSRPSASSDDWQFYLHNIKGLSLSKPAMVKKNISSCLSAFQNSSLSIEQKEKYTQMLEASLASLEYVDDASVSETLKGEKNNLLKILDDFTGEHFSCDALASVVYRDAFGGVNSSYKQKAPSHKSVHARHRMGLQDDLVLQSGEYEDLVYSREEYMNDALDLKEKMERKGADDDDDEGSDDEDEGGKEDKTEGSDGNNSHALEVETHEGGDPRSKLDTLEDKSDTAAVATVVEISEECIKVETITENGKIGKVTPHDDFCGDIPSAPEFLRRCLAVLRTLSLTNAAEPFLYPVDPQSNPGYYESILQPMCFREAGKQLQAAAKSLAEMVTPLNEEIELSVASFARNIRLIGRNCSCYANAGPMIIAAGDEMLRIFERLFLDWVIAPAHVLPPLQGLDDDRCVVFHESDEDSMVLLCDGCEGKYNMSRLQPPLREVPKGDWFCPRCSSGRSWNNLDPRIGKNVFKVSGGNKLTGLVKKSFFSFPEKSNSKPLLLYQVVFHDEEVYWSLEEVDKSLSEYGITFDPVLCIEAISESPGYGGGTDRGLYSDLVPSPLNPRISENAAKATIASSVYRSAIAASNAFLLTDPENLLASEWLQLLDLLLTLCASSEMMMSLATKLEADSAEGMTKLQGNISLRPPLSEMLPLVTDDESECHDSGTSLQVVDEGHQATVGNPDYEKSDDAMLIDAGAIEVVSDVNVKSFQSSGLGIAVNVFAQPNPVFSQCDTYKHLRKVALDAQETRQKAREDALLALAIKAQLRPTVASFEEDMMSQVVDSTLAPTEQSFYVTSCRRRGVLCDFCGLSDVALGAPLVRVPNEREWKALMPHSTRARQVFLVANTPPVNIDQEDKPRSMKLRTLKIFIGGELFSNMKDDDFFDQILDGGLLAYLPSDADGFQDELAFRENVKLPFVTGSLSAHECCAVAAHNSRKERVVQDFKDKRSRITEVDSGNFCGRTLSLGRDFVGRSYWQLKDKESLFVGPADGEERLWCRFVDSDVIASLMSCLARDPIVFELKRLFPQAARLLINRKWSQMLQKRQFKGMACPLSILGISDVDTKEIDLISHDVDEEDEPYNSGEDVLVESKCGKILWDATVVAVSQQEGNNKVSGYFVHYKRWSSRFDEWVEPPRVVEPTENNLQVQEEMLEEMISSLDRVPEPLETMKAKQFLRASDRARGNAAVPNFFDIVATPLSASSGQKALAVAKAALLLVEASLPIGAIDNSKTGVWRPYYAAKWRKMVEKAEGPCALSTCAFLFEESLSPEWIDQHIIHMLSCLPVKWKAIRDANVSNVALRIALLDSGLDYGTVDTTKYKNRSRK